MIVARPRLTPAFDVRVRVVDAPDSRGEGHSTGRICWQCGETFSADLEYCPDDGNQLVELDPSDAKDMLVGRVFDYRFRIVRKLGEGGMSRVYSARRLDEDGEVALKVLKADFLRNPEVRKRFMYEARVISNLEHGNAVDLFDFGQAPDGSFYMVMELLEGQSLADRLDGGALGYREIFAVVPPVCEVLAEAHEQDVIHRDLKPENIFLTGMDQRLPAPKLLDFGIAKHLRSRTMTENDQLWGTPAYMSPEQASGDSVAGTADIYATGVMLYELIAGVLPFRASTAMGFAVKHMHREAPSLSSVPGLEDVPHRLDEFVQGMLAKSPADRPKDMQTVADELRGIQRSLFDEELLETVPSLQTEYDEIEAPSGDDVSVEDVPPEATEGVVTVDEENPTGAMSRADVEAGVGEGSMPDTPTRGSAAETSDFETPVFESGGAKERLRSWTKGPKGIAVAAGTVIALVGAVYVFGASSSTSSSSSSSSPSAASSAGAAEAAGVVEVDTGGEASDPSNVASQQATSGAARVAASVSVRARTVAIEAGDDERAEGSSAPRSPGERNRTPPSENEATVSGTSGKQEDDEPSEQKTKEAVESTF